MQQRTVYDNRFTIALVLALPLILAIGIPLYLSGNPTTTDPTPGSLALIAPTQQPATNTPVVLPPTQTPTPAITSTPRPLLNPNASTQIDDLIAQMDGVYGIVLAGAGQSPVYTKNADVPFVAASLYKLILMTEIYAKVDAGELSLDQMLPLLPEYFPVEGDADDSFYNVGEAPEWISLEDALFATGAYSSNVAAHALLSLTDTDAMKSRADSLGMTGSYFAVLPDELAEWPPALGEDSTQADLDRALTFLDQQAALGPVMITTPRDMQTFFSKMLDGQIVNQNVSNMLMDLLNQQKVVDRFPCLLPPNTQLAHKTGNLETVVHDVGVIWNERGPVILIAMTEDDADDYLASLIVQRLALIAYGTDDVPPLTGDVVAGTECLT